MGDLAKRSLPSRTESNLLPVKIVEMVKKTLENAQKIFILVIFVALGQSYEETSATVIHANSGRSLGAALRFIGAGAGQGHRQTDRSGCRRAAAGRTVGRGRRRRQFLP